MKPEQKQAFIEGFRDVAQSGVTVLIWGFVTGIALAKSTLTVYQAISMNLFVYAGVSQLAALPLIAVGIPIWVILITSFMVNLRFVIFSLALQAHFSHLPVWRRIFLGYCTADFGYLFFIKRYPKPLSVDERRGDPHQIPLHVLMGMQFANWSFWQVGAIGGILLASQIPNDWGLQFAGAVALVAIVMPMLDRPAARWAAVTAAAVAVMTYGIPLRLNIILAIVAAIIVGMMTDRSPKTRMTS